MTRCPYVWFHFLIFQTQVFCTVASILLLCLFEVCYGVLYSNFFPRHCAIQNCCIMSYTLNRAGVEGNIKSEKKIRNWIEKKLKWLQAMIRKSNPLFYQVIANPCSVSFIRFHCCFIWRFTHITSRFTLFNTEKIRVPEERSLLFTSMYL